MKLQKLNWEDCLLAAGAQTKNARVSVLGERDQLASGEAGAGRGDTCA